MSFDFAVTDDSSTTTEDNEAVRTVNPDFESNETAEIYISAGDWKATLGAMLEALDLEALKIYSDDTLEDVSRLLGEYSEAHPQQKLHMVASLLKSTAGKAQRDNDHTIGFVNGKVPEDHDDDGLSNSVDVSYALHFSELPSINWDDLDGGERDSLEEMGIDPSELGFDTNHGGPKLLVIDGQRLPIAVEEGNEVMEALELLQQLPSEPSAYTEDGLRESSDPSVFGDVDTDKVAEESSSDEDNDDEEVDYVNNPDLISEVGANTLRSGEGSVREIDSLRTVQTLLARESDGKARSTVMQALKERRSTLQGDEEDDEADTEEADSDEEADDEDSVEDVELSDSEMNLASTLIEAGKADDLQDAAQQIRSL